MVYLQVLIKNGEDGATIGTSTLTLGGDSASLKVG